MQITPDLLRKLNERYRNQEIPPKRRAFEALRDIAREHGHSILFPSAEADWIFDWFEKNTKPGSHAVGSMFTGAFYYDACFWPLHIPLVYGSYELNALDSLESMSSQLKQELMSQRDVSWTLALYWADCLDYAYGIDDILKDESLSSRTKSFLENGDRELIGAIAQLNAHRPNTKAILNLRMACEIFLKAFLIQERNLTEDALKKLGHKIEVIAKECFAVTALQEFRFIEQGARIFPDVSERYDGAARTTGDAWEALCITQIAASTVTRKYSGRDSRSQLNKGANGDKNTEQNKTGPA